MLTWTTIYFLLSLGLMTVWIVMLIMDAGGPS